MQTRRLGESTLNIPPICLGTMTFGEQVDEADAHHIIDVALTQGVNFWDTAEMYAVPPRAATFGATEWIIGGWLAKNPHQRKDIILATKVAGPSRGMPWIREGDGLTANDIIRSCEGSLRRLHTDYIDLYQIHWPTRHVPMFGVKYFNPDQDAPATSLLEQLTALTQLVKQGKVREIGLSNETPYGVHECIHLAEKHGLARVVSVQNGFSLLNRSYENGLDESCHRLNVGMLAYSPLSFGLLTGKYDESGLNGAGAPAEARLTKFASMRQQRWGRPSALIAARRYNDLAKHYSLTPAQMALAFCYQHPLIASTIVGVTDTMQLMDNINALNVSLAAETLAEINHIREMHWDPAL